MSSTSWFESPLKALVIRLSPGADLKQALLDAIQTHQLQAACVLTCVGSLENASLRMAHQVEEDSFIGPWEITSLTGTLSPDGVHIHISLSDTKGDTIGGHLMHGSTIRTTAEIVLGVFPALQFRRVTDPETTFRELQISTKSEP